MCVPFIAALCDLIYTATKDTSQEAHFHYTSPIILMLSMVCNAKSKAAWFIIPMVLATCVALHHFKD